MSMGSGQPTGRITPNLAFLVDENDRRPPPVAPPWRRAGELSLTSEAAAWDIGRLRRLLPAIAGQATRRSVIRIDGRSWPPNGSTGRRECNARRHYFSSVL